MKKQIAKKTIILYVLMMLQKGSSPEHPITQTNIANVINSMGIPCDRKTVGRNIDYLIDFGVISALRRFKEFIEYIKSEENS